MGEKFCQCAFDFWILLRIHAEPIKREVLIDLCDLTRTTGKAIATAFTESLKKHKNDIANCRGQAYDTTSSMSSSKKGVQAEIAKCAPVADYQGCCLHALNLAICHACEIRPIHNMIDSCRELYSFFNNSPKRQRFLDIVIDVLGKGETEKRKLKNLCKTRWIERHSTFETIYDLYEYVVTTLDEICVPSEDGCFECPGEESWDWDASTRTLANGLRHTMKSFGHIFCFVCAMDMLEPMRPLVSALQGRLVEVCFGFKKVEEVLNSYTDIRSGIDKWFFCTRKFCVFQSWLDRLKSDHVLIVGVPLQQKRLRSIGSALSQYRF